jgi:hypothetical protein
MDRKPQKRKVTFRTPEIETERKKEKISRERTRT